AKRLKLTFLDSDHEIEAKEGQSVPEIFAQQGEAYFRGLERAFVETGHPQGGCIVACGGGLVTQPGMVDALRARGVVVCLFASPETILKRTQGNKNRPLLAVEDPAKRIRELMAQREPAYLRSGACIYTDQRPMSEVVDHLERFYRREARLWRKG
ncbi:MAG: shikimate kinase, partial [Verrucomicrobiota bacterium]